MFCRNTESRIDGFVEIEGAEVRNQFVWKKVRLSAGTYLNLRFTTVGVLSDEREGWPGKDMLFLDGFRYDRIDETSPLDRLDWIRLQTENHFLPQPYEQLATVLRNMGDSRRAIDVLIAKNDAEAKSTSRLWPGTRSRAGNRIRILAVECSDLRRVCHSLQRRVV